MSNLSINEVNSAIMHQDWTNDQLNAMVMALKYARERLSKRTVWSLRHGAQVKFTNSRTGQTMIGEVTKIKQKKVLVKVGATVWNVPAAMLSEA
jgi:hypothetical protein